MCKVLRMGVAVCKVLGMGVAVQLRIVNHTDCILPDTLTGNGWAVCGAVLSPPSLHSDWE